jgi:diketogulonate reductase-like aldo/keto reductase
MDKSSTYIAVEELVSKRLLIPTPRKRGTTYKAASPSILRELYQEKQFELENTGKKLDSIIASLVSESTANDSTYIKIESGIDAFERKNSIQLNSKEKLVRARFSSDSPLYSNPAYVKSTQNYFKERIKKGVFQKQLVDISKTYAFDEIMQSSIKLKKEVRILPSEISSENELIIVDDYVFIVIDRDIDNQTIITIHNKFIAELLKQLYDFIWIRSARYAGNDDAKTFSISDRLGKVYALGIGTWGVGGYWTNSKYNDDINDVDQIRHSITQGQNYIDTCLTYADGKGIELISQALKNMPRNSYVLNAKLSHNKAYPEKKPLMNKSEVKAQCEKYLEVFNTEYIDIIQVHAPKIADEIGLSELFNAINELISIGKVKCVAVSNFTVPDLKLAQKYCNTPIVANEIYYSLIERTHELDGTVDYCNDNNIKIIAYRPLEQGRIARVDELHHGEDFLSQLVKKYNKTSAQISLNWLIEHKKALPIVKSTNGSHINENIDSIGWRMEEADYIKLDKLTPEQF